jgi:hypothetical protein
MSYDIGGGIANTGKPAEYYKIIDRNKPCSSKKIQHHPNKFSEVLKAKNISNINKIQNNQSFKETQKLKSSNTLNHFDKKDGTDFALKKLAKEVEIQMMSMFFTLIDNARDIDPEGGFGEKLFRGHHLTEMVKQSSNEELGEIGKAIYRNLVKKENENEKN